AGATGAGAPPVRFLDLSGYTVGTIAGDACSAGASGLTSAGGNITLCAAAGDLRISAPIVTPGGIVRLQAAPPGNLAAGGSIIEDPAPVGIIATALGARAGKVISLTSGAN